MIAILPYVFVLLHFPVNQIVTKLVAVIIKGRYFETTPHLATISTTFFLHVCTLAYLLVMVLLHNRLLYTTQMG